jgi:hypothetical protein
LQMPPVAWPDTIPKILNKYSPGKELRAATVPISTFMFL